MILPLALTLSLLPQEPIPPGLAAHLEALDLHGHTFELAERIARASRFDKGIRSPAFLGNLRAGGKPLVDQALSLVPAGDGEIGLEQAQALIAELLGARALRSVPERRMDPQRFRELLEHLDRDLRRALGREAVPHERRSRLQAALERQYGTLPEHRDYEGYDLKHLETVDLPEIHRLCRIVVRAAMSLKRPELLERLAHRPTRSVYEDVVGEVLWDWDTSFGRFVVGGPGPNIYDCTQIDVIVDLGGEDLYRGPAGATTDYRRLGVVVDLEGNDRYEALNDGLGSATYGLGILLDLEGDDRYSARARSAGFGLAGLGLLADLEGDDVLELDHHGGGVGMAGVGCLLDLAGDDRHRAAGESFAVGLPGGLGFFLDTRGDDRRELGSIEAEDLLGSLDLSLGLGAGIGRWGRLEGGVGLLLDVEGDDAYRAGARALGSGAQGGLGMLFELSGHDTYSAGSGSLGAALDFGKSLFFDGAGRDEYAVQGGFGIGAAAQGGEAWFVELAGDDEYRLEGMGLGEARAPSIAGFLDLGGADFYLKERGPQGTRAVAGPRPRIDGALSLFLDQGRRPNRYAWEARPSPRPREPFWEATPDGRSLAVVVLVDR